MPYLGYLFILLVCLTVGLVCFSKIRPQAFLLYGIGAGMVLVASLAGPYLIGSDIHLEYFFAHLRAGKDVLQPIVGIPQGTSILFYLTDNIWVYKLVYPLLFALVPVILFYTYKRFLNPIQAFLASFAFIAFPAFFMELPGISRQMVAEVFLALLLFLLITKPKRGLILVILSSLLLPLLHYAVAITALILLIGGLILKGRRKLAVLSLGTIILVSSVWFPLSENGAVYLKLVHIYNSWVTIPPVKVLPKIEAPGIPKPQFVHPELAEHPPEVVPPSGLPFIDRYEALIQSGLGFDFFQTTFLGKAFRIIQFIYILLIPLGLWKLRKTKEYWTLGLGGLFLGLLLLLPGFSNLLNITRFLHLGLFVLAPAIGLSLRPKYLGFILIPYFLFSSGFLFEITKQPNIEKITIPYNVGLSDYRIDLGASFNENDRIVRQYIYDNKFFPVYADINGADFIGELVGWRDDLHAALRRDASPIREGYVFVRSRNIEDGTFTVWNGIGCRKFIRPEAYGINWNKDIIFQSGDSRILEVK